MKVREYNGFYILGKREGLKGFVAVFWTKEQGAEFIGDIHYWVGGHDRRGRFRTGLEAIEAAKKEIDRNHLSGIGKSEERKLKEYLG